MRLAGWPRLQPREAGAQVRALKQPLHHLPACLQADGAAAAMKQQIALGRIGTAEEAAGAMLMLASPYASYISGQAIEVTGGGWL